MVSSSNPKENQLLAALPDAQWKRWLPDLELVSLPLGHVIYEAGGVMKEVIFPATAIVSLLYVMESGASGEIAVVGSEGMVGVSLFMGGGSTPSRAVVQSAGQGFRLKADLMKNEFDKGGRCCICCCATPRRSSRKWRKRLSATGTTRLTSNCAAGS